MPTRPVGAISERNWVFPGEAAKIVGVHMKTIYDWNRRGILAALHTLGKHRRYSKKDVERLAILVKENRAAGRQHFLFRKG